MNTHIKKAIIVSAVVLSAHTLVALPIHAQVNTVDQQQVSGTVIRKDGQTVTLQNGDTVQEVTIPSNVSIVRNSNSVSINDVALNDTLKVTTDTTGQILGVEDTPASTLKFRNTGLTILAAVVILALAYLFIKRKTNQAHIKTTVGSTPAHM